MISGKNLCAAVMLVSLGFGMTAAARAGDAQPESAAEDAPGVAWQTDLRAAHQISVRHNKPLLLVFGADWCTFCKKLENETLGHPELANYVNQTFVPVHLDYDRDERAREILEVEKLPCTIILTPDADLLDRFEGYQKPAGYYKRLSNAKDLHNRMMQQTGAVGGR
ncbi:MAG: DUF255 domain-containing protein [Planctomycetota bacterium]|nr:MAG: DUF255 domain-containing protein [Planctomycetota bacterium]REJ88631.1 MAG: DUF255 domain-containing protein [Planctomycetota bacterium]REK27218.1 MAG: DUF255 domain-containing protein [Planctomycetota bacterium]REK36760.1 MAG: DUF255 domain-containing protein [Planctomycetota bacterium]